jgi:hypothetical protein
VRLLLTSDTHLPKRAKQIPGPLLDEIDRADAVFHAGDWVDTATLDLFEARARLLVAVHGNNDGPGLRERLSERADVELGGVRFSVVHETGPAQGRERRCAERFSGVTCWSSATATSRGTPRRKTGVCGCSTRARPPTAAASPTAPT